MPQIVKVWEKQSPLWNTKSYDYNPALHIDKFGNVIFTFQNGDNYKSIVTKLDNDGNFLWSKNYEEWNSLYAQNDPVLASDSYGNIYLGFYLFGNINGGTSSLGGYDITIVKLDSDGSLLWKKQIPGINTNQDEATLRMQINTNDELVLTYSSFGQITGGTASGATDVVISKIDGDGNIIWTKQSPNINTLTYDYPNSIFIDKYNNIYIIVNSNGDVLGTNYTGIYNFYVLKLNNNGDILWVRQDPQWLSNQNSGSGLIVADSSENVYFTYYTYGNIPEQTNSGDADIVAVTLDISGNTTSAVQPEGIANTPASDIVISVQIDSSDNIYLLFDISYNNKIIQVGGPNGYYVTSNLSLSTTDEFTSFYDNASLRIDSNGNMLIVYRTYKEVPGGTANGNNDSDVVVLKMNNDGDTIWAKQSPQWNVRSYDYTSYIKTGVDKYNNYYFAAWYYDVDDDIESIKLIKIDQEGNLLWIYKFKDLFDLDFWEIDEFGFDSLDFFVTENGFVYVSLSIYGQIKGGTYDSDNTDGAIAVLKINPNGNLVWSKQDPKFFDLFDGSYEPSISLDQYDNIYLSYVSYGQIQGGTNYGDQDLILFKMNSSGTLQWIKQQPSFNTIVNEYRPVVVTTKDGISYIMYITNGTIQGGTKIGNQDIVLSKFDSNGNLIWSKQDPDWNATSYKYGNNFSIDASENLYFVYMAYGLIEGGTQSGEYDIIVGKIDKNGNKIWIRQEPNWNTTTNENAPSIVVSKDGFIYVSYHTNNKVAEQTYIGDSDIVVLKLDLDGNEIWIKQNNTFNTSGAEYDPYINIDNSNNIFVTYTSYGDVSGNQNLQSYSGDIVVSKFVKQDPPIDLGEVALRWSKEIEEFQNYNLFPKVVVDSKGFIYVAYWCVPNIEDFDIIITKLSPYGVKQWSKIPQVEWNTPDFDFFHDIKMDSSDNIILSHITSGQLDGGTQYQEVELVFTKIDSDGEILWVKQDGTISFYINEAIPKIDIDSENNIVFTYVTAEEIPGGTNKGDDDVVVGKLSTDGTLLWLKQNPIINTELNDNDPDITVDSCDNIILVYATAGSLVNGTYLGNDDLVIVKFDKDGNIIWSKQNPSLNSYGQEENPSIATDKYNNIICVHSSTSNVEGLTNYGNNDVVIFKLDPDGNLLWIKQDLSLNTSSIEVNPEITVDKYGYIYITYTTGGNIPGQTLLDEDEVVLAKLDLSGNIMFAYQKEDWNTLTVDYLPHIIVDKHGNIYLTFITGSYYVRLAKFLQKTNLEIIPYSNKFTFGGYPYYNIDFADYVKIDNEFYLTNNSNLLYKELETSSLNNELLFYSEILPYGKPIIINPYVNDVNISDYDFYITPNDINSRFATYGKKKSNGLFYQIFQEGNSYVPLVDPSDAYIIDIYSQTTDSPINENDLILLTPPCFLIGQKVLTQRGYVAVEKINKDDFIISGDGKMCKIKEIVRKRVIGTYNNLPVCIPKNYFGNNYPSKPVYLSQGHAIKVNNLWCTVRDMKPEIRDSLIIKDYGKIVDYFHIELFNGNDTIITDGGLIVESFKNSINTNQKVKKINKIIV